MVSTRQLLRDYSAVLSFSMRVMDGFAVIFSAVLAYAWRFPYQSFQVPVKYSALTLIAFLLVLVIFPTFGIYRSWRGRSLLNFFSRLTFAWGTVLLVLVLSFFLVKETDYSRLWFAGWAIGTLLALVVLRVALFLLLQSMRKRGWNHKKVLILGAGNLGREMARRLAAYPGLGLDVVAFLDDRESLWGKTFSKARVEGGLSDVYSLVQRLNVDEVFIALPLKAEARVQQVFHELRHSTVNIRFVPNIFGFRLMNHSVTEIAGMPILDLSISPMAGINRFVKAIEDRLLALIILILMSPLLLIIAVSVKLTSRGPVLFKQLRHGWDGRPINVYKFRTMKVHNESAGQVTQASKGDPRITPLGAFLRRTSLDELPQFFNVLQGRMSIVGPRPHAVAHNEFYKEQIDAYMLRLKVKPGITGWAQINGWRGETDTLDKMKKRIEFDLYYIENWSLFLDLKIIALTLFRGFVHKNAY